MPALSCLGSYFMANQPHFPTHHPADGSWDANAPSLNIPRSGCPYLQAVPGWCDELEVPEL